MITLLLSVVALQASPPSAAETRGGQAGDRSEAVGKVEMECQWLQGGGLSRCRVISETPAGSGLGQALLDRMAMGPGRDGVGGLAPPAERVRFTVRTPLVVQPAADAAP